MKILVSGFEPFDKEGVNPSYEIVKKLEDTDKLSLVKLRLPVVFKEAGDILVREIDKHKPQVVLMLGQAGGRSHISLEKVAINYRDSKLADNKGQVPSQEPIRPGSVDGYFSNMNVEAMVEEIKKKGIPARVSYSAGTFVCNEIFYRVMYHINKNKLDTKAVFIHVPYLPCQVVDKPLTPSMGLGLMTEAIKILINNLRKE